ncbi:6875_t:CDS:2 [Dentiscutata erythropus]|uniref:6875_t:CDS:1 n=1 Tax=Dentiscutata erythropus TaxID=1348616 RepID=A0A9N9IZI4_9GLOM|nr:6875_t:CDS:2 [Dentiscutata erythropus]
MPNTQPKIPHEYFKRKWSEWNIQDFLDECNLKTFGQKIEEYLLSLEVIANTGENGRREKAQRLLDNYKKAISETSHKTNVEAQATSEVLDVKVSEMTQH